MILLSQSHIRYYKFLYGKKFSKFLKFFRKNSTAVKVSNNRAKKSVDSTEGSSRSTQTGSSELRTTSSCKTPTSTPSSTRASTSASTSKNNPSTTSATTAKVKKYFIKNKQSTSKNIKKDKVSKDKDLKNKNKKSPPLVEIPPSSDTQANSKANVIKNPLSNEAFTQSLISSQRRKSSTTDTQKSSTGPLTSFDSTDDAAGSHPSSGQNKPSTSRPGISFESLSSVSGLSGSLLSSFERFTFDEPNLQVKPRLYYQGITGIITHRLGNDISQAVPICSQPQKHKHIHQVEDDYISVQPQNIGRVQKLRLPQNQSVAAAEFDISPPSPAPGSIKGEEKEIHAHPVVSSRHKETYEGESYCELFYQEAYDPWWPDINGVKKAEVDSGPRAVILKVPNDTRNRPKYKIVEPEPKPEKIPYRQSYYGSSSPTKPFYSYLDQNPNAVYLNEEQSFAEKINKQYKERCDSKHYQGDDNKQPRASPSHDMNSMDDHERKIIIEFCHLLEKSKQLFNGLRELPQYGHKQWSLHFGRTFDIYTRLWKYQQQHRLILDSKYGMKRWQIGEIASKIGQLYYHFYLRTSETAYLNEAFSFYYAIRGRCYYTKANKEDKCELMVKKLRYYARFIVVCLLLKKMKLVKDLIKELDRQIIEYGNTYDPDDQVEWTVVVDEVKAFIHAEPVVAVIHTDNYPVTLSHRLTPLTTPPIERSAQMNLSLQEILIVGSSSQQVKFSELTMDMFRILQTLEREPTGDVQHIFDESPRQRFPGTPNAQNHDGIDPGQKMSNPHKYLLFKPSPSQMLVYLASGCNDLPPNGALLLYMSADGHVTQSSKHSEDATGYDLGGLITTSKNDIYRDCSKDQKAPTSSKFKELQCLYPGDLYPFARRPFFVIVESDNSYAFQSIPRHFGQPLVILMSPLELPPSFHDRRQQGSLFTLFLHSPLSAFCYLCDISNLSLMNWDRAHNYIDSFVAEAAAVFVRSRVDISYISFMGDDFLRLLMLRYVFCEVVLRMHRGFRARTHLPRCSPPLPDDLFEHPALIHIVMDLAGHLQVRSHFHDPNIGAGPPTSKD